MYNGGMKTIEGNLISLAKAGAFDVIVQGCNCFCTMGKGIALTIKQEFPEAYLADRKTAYGDRSKLGSYSQAMALGRTLTVVNAYTQFDWRGYGLKADYQAIEDAFNRLKVEFTGKRIGYPMIGAGLARGDWERISGIIDKALAGEDHTLVIYQP